MKYLRFVINGHDEDSNKRQGIFQTLVDIREKGQLHGYEETIVSKHHEWFNENLERPTKLRRSSKPHALNKAISWYKDTAQEHISRMYELSHILEAHDVPVEVIHTERPGYIVYEDEHQVTAEAFPETGA